MRLAISLAAVAAALMLASPAGADPLVASITGAPTSPGNATTVQWAFDPPAAECRLEAPDQSVIADWGACVSPAQYALGSGDGDYTFMVRSALGSGPADATSVYTLDTTPPGAPAITDGPPASTGSSSATFSFTTDQGSTTECRLERGGSAVSGWTACTSPWAYGLSTEPDGAYTFSVRAGDAAGNTGPAATRDFTLERTVPPANPPAADPAPVQLAPAAPVPPERVLRQGVCINLFNGTPRRDALHGSAFGDVLIGFDGNDRLDGQDGDDCVLGDKGDDTLYGGPGNDDVRGLAGDDRVSGGPGNDSVSGGDGDDAVSGAAGNDTLHGGRGVDRLSGGDGNDSLAGGRGDDLMTGGRGQDGFTGGAGNDQISSRDGEAETVDCGLGLDRVRADPQDRLIGCELVAR